MPICATYGLCFALAELLSDGTETVQVALISCLI